MAKDKETKRPERGSMSTARRFKTLFQFSMIGLAFVLIFAVFYRCTVQKNRLDADDVEIIQFDTPADDAPVCVFETTMGTYKAVLYPDIVPDYCDFFTSLVNEGYYDDTYIFAVENGVYFMGGSKTDDGTNNDDTNTKNYERELSPKLWPFKGSLVAFGDEKGIIVKETLAGSRIMFVNSVEFTDEFKDELDNAGGNKKLVEAFKEHGGVPNFSQQYTVFGQVIDGMDVYDKICSAEVNDEKTKRPMNDIKFTKVYMTTYGEIKGDMGKADSSESQSDSSSAADESK